MSLHVSGDYAVFFGLDGATNRLHTGGWSAGATSYQIWDSRDFSSTNISNWNTAHGWGNHASVGYITGYTETDTLQSVMSRGASTSTRFVSTLNTATGISNNSFNVAKTTLGNIHIQNGSGTSGDNKQAAITFQGDSASQVQAGIYVSNNSSTGTAMGFATTDSYSAGPKLFMTATNSGVVNFPRAVPTYAGTSLVYNSGTWGINITGNAATATNLGADYTADDWFRATADNNPVKLYGNTYQMTFRTDGAAEAYAGIGDYPFVWSYGGSTTETRIMLTATDGRLWTKRHGWLDEAFAPISHSHTFESLTSKPTTISGYGITDAITTSNIGSQAVDYATRSKWIDFPDGPRNLSDRRPNWNNRSVAWDFVTAATVGGAGNYAGVMTFSPWDGTAASTGDSSYQLAFYNITGVNASGIPGLKLRNGIDSTWNDFYTVWHSGNDGSGSGLDADLLDGNQASAFATLTGANSFSNSYNEFGNGVGSVSNDGSWNGRVNVAGTSHARLDVVSVSDGIVTSMYSHTGNNAGKMGTMSNHPLKLMVNGGDKATLDSSGNLSVTGTISATNFSGTSSGTNTGDQTNISGNSGTVGGLRVTDFFNNMGGVHGTRTSFDDSRPSYDFGWRYVQGSTNGPGTGGNQFYSVYVGLGNDYPATGSGSYGMYLAIDRNSDAPYLSVRYNENNGLSSWRKIRSGYADSAGTAGTAGNITAYTINQNLGTSNTPTFSGANLTSRLYLNGGPYEGSILFGSSTTWRCGIRQHDDADAELRIWAKNSNGMIFLATGYDGEPSAISRPTDGLVVGPGNNVGIGNFSSSDPGYKLQVNGTGYFQNNLTVAGTLTETSSIRYKTDVIDLDYGLNEILSMRPVQYKKKSTGDIEVGLIAEEIHEIVPEIVKYNQDNEADGLNYSRLTTILVNAIKELNDKVINLESRLNG